jgi:hypothetical protein
MEFGFTEEQEKLRKEVHEFFLNELPEDYVEGLGSMSKELQSFWMQLQKKAGDKRYITPGWPKEYGGMGLSGVEQAIVAEVEQSWGVLWPNFEGYIFLGPGLMLFGTEEQKKEFLPPIIRGEVLWMEGFTEPDAGSDSANINLRAVEDGEYYVLNGQKTWITGWHKPDWIFCQTRTEDTVPKHRGLTLFMVKADTPGITYRPLPGMGFATQNELFFDDVRVPKKNILGQLNNGFYHMMAIFEYERAGVGGGAGAQAALRRFIHYCREEKKNGKPLIEDPEVREKLARMAVENEMHRLIGWHAQWWFANRERLGPKPYDFSGYWAKQLPTKHAEWMLNIMGLYGQLRAGSKYVKYDGRLERSWLSGRAMHHEAGTIEINKNVLAQRGLGLPRIPAKFNMTIAQELSKGG